HELVAAGQASADDYSGLGAVCLLEDQYLEAKEYLGKAQLLRPDHPQTLSNLGLACFHLGETERARTLLMQAIALQPDLAASYSNLALLQQSCGEVEQAIATYHRALECDPSQVTAHWHLAHSLFLIDAYSEAWPEHEWRLQDAPERKLHAMPQAPCLAFSAEALEYDGPLLLVSEQGIGDTLQFIRYVRLLQARGCQIRLCLPDQLHALVGHAFPDIELLSPEQGSDWCEGSWLALMSVPGLLKESPSNPLVSKPYLHADSAHVASWRNVLGDSSEQQPLVALHWQGNPAAEVGPLQGRSFPLQTLAPLAALADVRFVSLQKGIGAEQLVRCDFRDRFIPAQPLVDEAWDFLDTAAILASCDLVITSDTALAHLAGALGRPTWLLLHHIPDWRWGVRGDSTFWYPSMRLFRQLEAGNWDELVTRLTPALRQFLVSQ
ncbi:MAG: tetratricopeptide repeat protein, partial [Synechococcus sp.]